MPHGVRLPLRMIHSSFYADATLSVYIKVAALSCRREGCTAGVAYLAPLLGMSRSGVERAFTQMMRPAPDDQVVEMTSQRCTLPSGRGTTATRRVRKVNLKREPGAWVPSNLPEAVSPRLVRCYAAISYAVATNTPVSYAELGIILRHRTGKRAGEPLGDKAVGSIVRELARLGWIGIEERAGYQGRHLYTVYTEPTHLPLNADLGEGSGGDLDDGSLTTEEDQQIDSPDDGALAGGSIRRRRDNGSYRAEPVENPELPPALKAAYTGPCLSLAPRIWHILTSVHHLLPALTPYVLRKAAREIGRQLDQGVEPQRLRGRLEARYACTDTIQDPGRWLLGAALLHHGCGLLACESGVIWHSGDLCSVCADLRASRRPQGKPVGPTRPSWPPPPPASPPRPASTRRGTWCPCPDCEPAPAGRGT